MRRSGTKIEKDPSETNGVNGNADGMNGHTNGVNGLANEVNGTSNGVGRTSISNGSVLDDQTTRAGEGQGTPAKWGRAWEVDWLTFFGCLFLLLVCPFFPSFFILSCQKHQCSLLDTLTSPSTPSSLVAIIKSSSWNIAGVYVFWLMLQVTLALIPDFVHRILPIYKGGEQFGAVTPAGIMNKYNINGLQAWIVTHVLWFANAFCWKIFSPSIISQNLPAFLLVTNLTGYFFCFFSYFKAKYFPTNPEDCKFSDSVVYDFTMGIEFNPRIGNLDFKLFCNGRPGIVCWTLINLSFAWHQWEKYGYVTDSMILINLLQAIYVTDFFWNETWYLKTIDICHDHFGFYLAWGDFVWLPFMYTLQGQYLVYHPVQLGLPYFLFILSLGLVGYYIFRDANSQKDRFRADPTGTKIWGKSATYVKCSYTSGDGKEHSSTLLTSGWWGKARHMNYTGDLLGSLSYCLCCGFGHIFPYFYIIFMSMLLLHRIYRDEHRCSAKYGKYWDEYCNVVRSRLIPGVY